MLFRFKKLLSVFALVAFLFPLVVEQVHAFEHGNDFHCTEQNEKHFHVLEHHCHVCDFVSLAYNPPVNSNGILKDVVFTTALFSHYQNIAVIKHSYNFSLRGPPAVA